MLTEMSCILSMQDRIWNVPTDDEQVQRFYKNLGASGLKEWAMILHDKSLDELALCTAG
jgi:hypothetical protein